MGNARNFCGSRVEMKKTGATTDGPDFTDFPFCPPNWRRMSTWLSNNSLL
jgi:hypothetical protein